jgi:superfamily II DNA or RNA helicase
MVQIRINNSFSRLVGEVPETIVERIAEKLTYFNEEAHFEKINLQIAARKYRNNPQIIKKIQWKLKFVEENIWVCLLGSDLSFGTGLLDLVLGVLTTEKCEYQIKDARIKPESDQIFRWSNSQPTLRPYQAEMVELALREHRGVFNSAVGSGKTFIFINIIKKLSVDTLIVVPSRALKSQIQDDLISAFGRGVVESIDTKSAERGKKFKPIKLVTIQTLTSLKKRGLLGKLLDPVRLLVLDEAHRAGAESYTALLPDLDHIYYRFLFSGTFLRNDSKTLELWSICSRVLYSYYPRDAIRDGFLTPTHFFIHQVCGMAEESYQKEYSANYCGGSELLKCILSLVQTNSEKTILILVNRKDSSGNIIHQLLKDHNLDNVYISGDDKPSHIEKIRQQYNAGKIKILIASQIFGEGVNIKPVELLINAQGGKSEIATVQSIGRGVRLFKNKDILEVHDFLFGGTKYLARHLKQRLDIYERNFGGELIWR